MVALLILAALTAFDTISALEALAALSVLAAFATIIGSQNLGDLGDIGNIGDIGTPCSFFVGVDDKLFKNSLWLFENGRWVFKKGKLIFPKGTHYENSEQLKYYTSIFQSALENEMKAILNREEKIQELIEGNKKIEQCLSLAKYYTIQNGSLTEEVNEKKKAATAATEAKNAAEAQVTHITTLLTTSRTFHNTQVKSWTRR